jgi:hypothetical protein
MTMNNPDCSSSGWGSRSSRAASGRRPFPALILFFACFLARPFPSQRGLHALLFTRLQVEGVSLDLLDDVFLLDLALEAAKCVLEGFTLLQSNFCQT